MVLPTPSGFATQSERQMQQIQVMNLGFIKVMNQRFIEVMNEGFIKVMNQGFIQMYYFSKSINKCCEVNVYYI